MVKRKEFYESKHVQNRNKKTGAEEGRPRYQITKFQDFLTQVGRKKKNLHRSQSKNKSDMEIFLLRSSTGLVNSNINSTLYIKKKR